MLKNLNKTEVKKPICGLDCEIYSRIVGYFRPIKEWNSAKKEEFRERKNYAMSLTKPSVGKSKFKVTFDDNGDPTVNEI